VTDVGRRGISALVAAGLTLCGCHSSGGSGAAPAQLPASSTTVPRATTTTSTPDFSFDDSVPPPKLINTGTDYVAILKSLEAYGNWTAAHRPDPRLVSGFVAGGTALSRSYINTLTILRDKHQRAVETLGGQSKVVIVSARPDSFSARVTEDINAHRVNDDSGHIVDEAHFQGLTTYLDLAVRVDGKWRLAAIDVTRAPETLP
jgi:hypothetical protein